MAGVLHYFIKPLMAWNYNGCVRLKTRLNFAVMSENMPPAAGDKSAEELKAQLAAKDTEIALAKEKAEVEAAARAKAEAAIVKEKNAFDAYKRANQGGAGEGMDEEAVEKLVQSAVSKHQEKLLQETIEESAAALIQDPELRGKVLERYTSYQKSGMTPSAIKKDLDDIAFLLNRPKIEATIKEAKTAAEGGGSGGSGAFNGTPPANKNDDQLSSQEEAIVKELARRTGTKEETARATFIKNKREAARS